MAVAKMIYGSFASRLVELSSLTTSIASIVYPTDFPKDYRFIGQLAGQTSRIVELTGGSTKVVIDVSKQNFVGIIKL